MNLIKPRRGAALVARRERHKLLKHAESDVMRQAKARDRFRCRVPSCPHKDLPTDACHFRHRGMGGNPAGDRTTRETIITLCRLHHGDYDTGRLTITPGTSHGFDGPCAFTEDR
jgi:hypothetical protein